MDASDARLLAVIGKDFRNMLLNAVLAGQSHITKFIPISARPMWARAASVQGWQLTYLDAERVTFIPKEEKAWENLRLRVCDVISSVEKAITNAAALGKHDTPVSVSFCTNQDTYTYIDLWCKRNGFKVESRSGFLLVSWEEPDESE